MRRGARRLDRVADAEAAQRLDRVGPQRDARADLAQLRLRARGPATSRPARCSAIAVARPAMPAPMTRARSFMSRRYGRGRSFASAISPVRRGEVRIGMCSSAERPSCAAVEGLIAGAGSSQSGALVVRGDPGARQVGAARARDRARDGDAGAARRGDRGRVRARVRRAAPARAARSSTCSTRLPEPQAAALAGALGLSRVSVQDRFLIGVGGSQPARGGRGGRCRWCAWSTMPSGWTGRRPMRSRSPRGASRRRASCCSSPRATASCGASRRRGWRSCASAASTPTRPGRCSPSTCATALSADVRDRLVENAGGNPLALIELAGLLSDEQLAGRAPLPDPLPQSAEIERVYLERARALPAAAQVLLLLVAADDTGSLATVFEAAATLGIEPDALEPAEAAGLVRAFDGHVEFRHPLVRSTLYRDATFAQRQAAHRALADVFDGDQDADRRAWHRAAASPGQDDEVAGELEQAARRARRRSGFAAAARALERAAELSSDDEARGRRLVAAARGRLARRRSRAGARAARSRRRARRRRARPRRRVAPARNDRAALRGPRRRRDDPGRRRRRGVAGRSREGDRDARRGRPGRLVCRRRRADRRVRPARVGAAGATTIPTSASRSTSSSASAACSPVTRRAACRSCGRRSPWPPASRIPAAWCTPARAPAISARRRPSTSSTVVRPRAPVRRARWRCCRTSSSSSPAPRRWTGATRRPPPTPARG